MKKYFVTASLLSFCVTFNGLATESNLNEPQLMLDNVSDVYYRKNSYSSFAIQRDGAIWKIPDMGSPINTGLIITPDLIQELQPFAVESFAALLKNGELIIYHEGQKVTPWATPPKDIIQIETSYNSGLYALRSNGTMLHWNPYNGTDGTICSSKIKDISKILLSAKGVSALAINSKGEILTTGYICSDDNAIYKYPLTSYGISDKPLEIVYNNSYEFTILDTNRTAYTFLVDYNNQPLISQQKDIRALGHSQIWGTGDGIAPVYITNKGEFISPYHSTNILLEDAKLADSIKVTNTIVSWRNTDSTIGFWDNENIISKEGRERLLALKNIKQIHTTVDIFASLSTDGKVNCWGNSSFSNAECSLENHEIENVKKLTTSMWGIGILRNDGTLLYISNEPQKISLIAAREIIEIYGTMMNILAKDIDGSLYKINSY
ncbi:hypothetical protein I6M45_20385 [Shewanella algae]|uniref:hypothetical protein n=1 Tax=Shewanella algae TaxID=38313 RepID=UPI001AAD8EE0|nr:hypothetical protein [Shewanella algae]MBO2647442.1 hypothetical protein [Shewanella algae]